MSEQNAQGGWYDSVGAGWHHTINYGSGACYPAIPVSGPSLTYTSPEIAAEYLRSLGYTVTAPTSKEEESE